MDGGLGIMLPFLLLFRVAAADSGVIVNQMDLLSGAPALLVILVGIVQVWPSPAHLCRPGLYAFLRWLKVSVENDFYISVFSCEKRCQTQLFEPTADSIGKRISINVGDAREIGCIGSGDITVDELIDIIQADNNGITLAELAMAARYPRMRQLNRIITVLRFSPRLGKRVIIFQWLAVALAYAFSWVFRGWLFSAIDRFFYGTWNVVRRIFGRLPVDRVHYRRFGLDYHISELAEHRLVYEHLPWVRYSVYYLILKLAGRRLSIKAWGIEDKKSIFNTDDNSLGDVKGNEDSPVFEHHMVNQRRLAALIATDECSAALLLYAISLHSLRVMMLCRHIGFLPPHVVTGSYSHVGLDLEHTIIVFKHSRLEALYKALYRYRGYYKNKTEIGSGVRDYLHLSYSLLLKKLQSPLGDQITGQQQIHILMNLSLLNVDTHYVDRVRGVNTQTADPVPPHIEGIILGDDMLSRLYRGHMTTLLRIHRILESFLVADMYWGTTIWLLRTVLAVCKNLRHLEPDTKITGTYQEAGRSGRTLDVLEMLYLLINSAFPIHLYDQIRKDNAAETWAEPEIAVKTSDKGKSAAEKVEPKKKTRNFDVEPAMGEKRLPNKGGRLFDTIKNRLAFDDEKECRSAPAWCVCAEHCRGICTLVVNELEMRISIFNYLWAPYSFKMHTIKEKPLSSGNCNGTGSADSTPTTLTHLVQLHASPEQPSTIEPSSVDPAQSQSQSDKTRQNATNTASNENSDNDEEVHDTPNVLLRMDNVEPGATANNTVKSDISNAKALRLVCICNRHLLLRLVKNGKVTRRGKCYRMLEASDTPTTAEPNNAKSPIAKWWQSVNIQHLSTQKNQRIDNTYYPLSDRLYEDTAQLVIILGDRLFTARPSESISPEASAQAPVNHHQDSWPYNKFENDINDCLEHGTTETIKCVLPLRLPSADVFAEQITKEVAMSRGRLQRGRHQRRRDQYTLDPPTDNIKVKLD